MRLASSLVAAAALLLGSVALTSGAPARATDSGPVIALYAVACPDASAVPANSVVRPAVDDTGGSYLNWGPARSGPVDIAEATACTPRPGITFRLSAVEQGAALSSSSGSRVAVGAEDGETTTIVGTTGGNGLVIVPVANLTESQRVDLERGNSLWVSGGAPVGFLGLRCHTDLVNSDDLEFFRVAPFEIPNQLTCVHYSQGASAPTTTTSTTTTTTSTTTISTTTTSAPTPPAPVTQPPPTVPGTQAPTTAAPPATRPPTVPTSPSPSTTAGPAPTSTSTSTSTTVEAATTTTTVATSPTTASPTASTAPTPPIGDEDETALPARPSRIRASATAPGTGPLSARLDSVWTQDLLLSFLCGDEELELRVPPSRDGAEQDIEAPAHLIGGTCEVALLSDGVDEASHDAGQATISVNGTRIAEGDTIEIVLDPGGPVVEATYAAVGIETVLPEIAENTDSGGTDRLPLVPVSIALLAAALAGGWLIGRTSDRG